MDYLCKEASEEAAAATWQRIGSMWEGLALYQAHLPTEPMEEARLGKWWLRKHPRKPYHREIAAIAAFNAITDYIKQISEATDSNKDQTMNIENNQETTERPAEAVVPEAQG